MLSLPSSNVSFDVTLPAVSYTDWKASLARHRFIAYNMYNDISFVSC